MDRRRMEKLAADLSGVRDPLADILELAEREQASWNDRLGRLKRDGTPTAAYGPFRQMMDGAICLADQTVVTGTTETPMWPVAQYTGWGANSLRAGQIWELHAFGTLTTAAATPGNITITPRFGTGSSGTGLGASAATALTANATTVAWDLKYKFVVRTVGAAGPNSNVVGGGKFVTTVAAVAASVGNVIPFGSTASVAVDLSINAGLYMGVTLGAVGDQLKTLFVGLESIN